MHLARILPFSLHVFRIVCLSIMHGLPIGTVLRPNARGELLGKSASFLPVSSSASLGAVLASTQLLSRTFLQSAPSPWGLGTTSSCHLRQGSFSLGQPEGHVHGAV